MGQPRFIGSFLDIVHPNARDAVYWNRRTIAFEDSEWHDLVAHLHDDFGIQKLILLNVCAPHGAFLFPCPSLEGRGLALRFPTKSKDPVGAILDAASGHGMEVFLGLGVEPGATSSSLDSGHHKLVWHTRLAQALIDRYGHYDSLHGIYVAAEPCFGTDGLLPDSQIQWLAALTSAIRPVIGDRPLLACPFHHWKIETARPDQAMLVKQIRASGIDIVCPQDGVGFGTPGDPRPASRSAAAGRTLHSACREAGVDFWYLVETFAFENDILFQPLLPAPWSRIQEQLEFALTLSDNLIAYQIPGLMTSQDRFPGLGDASSDRLFHAYRSHLFSGAGLAP